jgi:hypothetical protein
MTLSEKHGIEFSEAVHSDTYTVIAKGRCGTSERVSGKPILGNANTALELAKRNAARQLLPYAELKAVEKKAQLEATFDWQKAKSKCVELVGEANVSIIIHDLTQAGKLRQDNPSHYDRTEWLMIYSACQKDAVFTKVNQSSQVERDPKSLNRWSYNSAEIIAECQAAIEQVRAKKLFVPCAHNSLSSSSGIDEHNAQKIEAETDGNVRRKPITQIFGRSNGTTKKLSKRYDEKPLEFEVDTTKPNLVKLIFSNGTVATVYDQTIYESVLRA